MKNSEYWQKRFSLLEDSRHNAGAEIYKTIERQYQRAKKEIESEISRWYRRIADNNGVSMAEAQKLLKADELKEFHWDVDEYIKYGEENAISGEWAKELENASAKFHISRLEALEINTRQSVEALYGKQQSLVSDFLGETYKSDYYHTAFELQKGFEIGFDIGKVNEDYLQKVLFKPWAPYGRNFSDRIWENKDKLVNEIHKELTQNILTGADPQKAIDNIAHDMNVSKANAGKLVMTESAYFGTLAQQDCFNDLGVEEYEIVATLDDRTSAICQSMDGQHFPMKDFEAGVSAPPFHVNCRTTTCPYFNDEFSLGERAARDENGEVYYVPSDMTYPEWKEAFVDGGSKEEFVVLEDYGKSPEPDKPDVYTETKEYVYDAKEDRLIEITTKNTEQKTAENIDVEGKKEYNKNGAKSIHAQEEVKPYLQRKLIYEWDKKENYIPQGAEFDVVITIAGAGTNTELKIVEGLMSIYGGTRDEWKKCVGKITSDKYIFDVHWYERADGIQHDEKVKCRKERKK